MSAKSLIVEARRRSGLTQSELAARIGTKQPAVSRWEAGRTSVDFSTVERIVDACGYQMTVSIDPKDDHDSALIRRELRKDPSERLTDMIVAVDTFRRMSEASHA